MSYELDPVSQKSLSQGRANHYVSENFCYAKKNRNICGPFKNSGSIILVWDEQLVLNKGFILAIDFAGKRLQQPLTNSPNITKCLSGVESRLLKVNQNGNDNWKGH